MISQCFKSVFLLSLIVATLLFLSACSSAVVFTTSTNVGIELNTLNGGMQTAKVGYQRIEGVTMPHTKQSGQQRSKAYSVVSMFDMKTGGLNFKELGAVQIKQVFATGLAAKGSNGEGAAKAVASGFAAMHGKHLSELMDAQTLTSAKELLAFLEKHRFAEKAQNIFDAMAKALGDPSQNSYKNLRVKIPRIADQPDKAKLLGKALKAAQEVLSNQSAQPKSKPKTQPNITTKPKV